MDKAKVAFFVIWNILILSGLLFVSYLYGQKGAICYTIGFCIPCLLYFFNERIIDKLIDYFG